MPQSHDWHGLVHELLTLAAAVLIVATGLAAIVTDRLMRRGVLGPPDRIFRGEVLLLVPLVSLSLGAAAIHFTVMPEHFQEWWASGLFFIAAAWFQAWWALLFALRPSRAVAAVGALFNAVIVVAWAASRTVGLPFGPHAGEVEPVGLADVVATAFEVLIVGGGTLVALGAGRRAIGAVKMRIAPAVMMGTVWAVGVALVTTLGVASLTTAASHHGPREPAATEHGAEGSGHEPGSHEHTPATPAPADAAPAPSAGTLPGTPKPAVAPGGTRKPATKPTAKPTPEHSHSHP
jgi:hypothetical protein